MSDILKTIEEWKKIFSTKEHIFSGMKEANNFASGKALTKEEYEKAVDVFLYGKKENLPERNTFELKTERKYFNRKEKKENNEEAVNA